jgi:hypothetical protein
MLTPWRLGRSCRDEMNVHSQVTNRLPSQGRTLVRAQVVRDEMQLLPLRRGTVEATQELHKVRRREVRCALHTDFLLEKLRSPQLSAAPSTAIVTLDAGRLGLRGSLARLETFISDADLAPGLRDDLRLCAEELLSNVLGHGSPREVFTLTVALIPEGGVRLREFVAQRASRRCQPS